MGHGDDRRRRRAAAVGTGARAAAASTRSRRRSSRCTTTPCRLARPTGHRSWQWYDELVALTDNPAAALSRAVAVGQVDGPLAGLRATDGLDERLPDDTTVWTPSAPICTSARAISAAAELYTRAATRSRSTPRARPSHEAGSSPSFPLSASDAVRTRGARRGRPRTTAGFRDRRAHRRPIVIAGHRRRRGPGEVVVQRSERSSSVDRRPPSPRRNRRSPGGPSPRADRCRCVCAPPRSRRRTRAEYAGGPPSASAQ